MRAAKFQAFGNLTIVTFAVAVMLLFAGLFPCDFVTLSTGITHLASIIQSCCNSGSSSKHIDDHHNAVANITTTFKRAGEKEVNSVVYYYSMQAWHEMKKRNYRFQPGLIGKEFSPFIGFGNLLKYFISLFDQSFEVSGEIQFIK